MYVPCPTDTLSIVSDASVDCNGIGALLYIQRGNNLLYGGCYSKKLKSYQTRWQPCELEAFSISSAIDHWKHMILQSENTVNVVTDSLPCVLA